jgi:hypothetical protein
MGVSGKELGDPQPLLKAALFSLPSITSKSALDQTASAKNGKQLAKKGEKKLRAGPELETPINTVLDKGEQK